MTWLFITIGVLFVIFGLACLISVALGIPGTWILLGLAFIIELTDGWFRPEGTQTFPWWLLITCILLAILGEIFEFFAGLLGAKKAGSSKKGMIGALIGGIVGAILGVSIPIPIVGSLIGAIIGTFLGAVLGEMQHDPEVDFRGTLKPATGATIGRILGTLSKLPTTLAIWLGLSIAYFW